MSAQCSFKFVRHVIIAIKVLPFPKGVLNIICSVRAFFLPHLFHRYSILSIYIMLTSNIFTVHGIWWVNSKDQAILLSKYQIHKIPKTIFDDVINFSRS